MTTPDSAPEPSPRPRSRARLLLIAGVVVAFAAVIGLGQVFINRAHGPERADAPAAASAGPTAAPAATAEAGATGAPGKVSAADSPLVLRDPADPAALGDVDAPLVLIEWTDLRCPFCAAFTNDTFPTVIDEYIAAGKVRLEVAPIAMFGEQSAQAAVAVHAAGKQGMFFEYLRTVYAAAPTAAKPDLPREQLIAFAEQAGVADIAQFTADLDDPELHKKVADETAFARHVGVTAVPFFLAGEVSLPGAQSVETFREYLDHFDLESE